MGRLPTAIFWTFPATVHDIVQQRSVLLDPAQDRQTAIVNNPNPLPTADIAESCYHCGEPVPSGADFHLSIGGVERPMCCPGCRAVASMITDNGLERFYERRTAYAERPEDAQVEDTQRFAIYDDPGLLAQFSEVQNEHRRMRLLLGGVTCAACTWLIETSLLRHPGITAASVNLSQGRLDIEFVEDELRPSDVFTAVAALGYQVSPWHSNAQRDQAAAEYRTDLRRLAVAGIGMMQVGMFAIALHAGDLQGISEEYQRLLRLFSLLVTGFVVAFSARGFFESAWRHLRHGMLVMDLPVALAIGLAFTASCIATLRGGGDVYFDSVVMFTFLLLSARFIEKRLRYRDALAWQDAEKALPDAAQVQRGGIWLSVPRRDIVAGDLVRVRRGDTLPVDGMVTEGTSAVREDSFNGESLPRTVQAGDRVYAGTHNLDASLELRASGAYTQSRLAALQRSIDGARLEKPAIARLADRVASVFIAAVLLATGVTALVWWQIDASHALWVAVSVLVISCPCALSLATPAGLASAAARLRHHAILVHGENALEALARVDYAIFDKTGTLTTGAFSVAECIRLDDSLDEAQVMALAATLQEHSNHPIASAFHSDQRSPVTNIHYHVGAGLEGRYEQRRLRMGSRDFCQHIAAMPEPPQRNGYWIALCLENRPLAWFALRDEARSEADAVLRELRRRGVSTELLTGDASHHGQALGAALGFERIQTGMQPEGKLARVRELQRAGHCVLMVGDGLNDAPVLKGADVSIAVAGATDLARAQADFVILDGNLRQLLTIHNVAVGCHRIIRQNFAWALAYNGIGIPIAALGLVPPWAAAIGMSLSSLLVVANAARLRRTTVESTI